MGSVSIYAGQRWMRTSTFPNWSPAEIDRLAKEQAKQVARDLKDQGRYIEPDKEIVALIAYLQSQGKRWEPAGVAAK